MSERKRKEIMKTERKARRLGSRKEERERMKAGNTVSHTAL